MDGACGFLGEKKGKQNFKEKFEGKTSFRQLCLTRKDNIKMTFKAEGGLWTGFIWLRTGRSEGFFIRLW